MKSLAVLAVLAVLVSGAAVAQSSQDLGNVRTAGATYADGIVDASSTTSLSIKNDAGGRLTFVLDSHTVNAMNHAVGTRVKINYHTNENGVAIADEIQGPASSSADAAAAKSTSATATTSSTSSTYAASEPKPAPVATETAPVAPAPVVTEAAPAPATTAPAKLPKTASILPTLAVIGLASLAGFAALRSVRR